MKTLLKKIIKFFNTALYLILERKISVKKTSFYFVKLKIDKTNYINFNRSEIIKTQIFLSGQTNLIEVNNALISKSNITISGVKNKLIIEPDVKLRSATIHIRGNNCMIKIGKGTSFGGIRIVNVGINNDIDIGENCLFADYIEIWASDTHSIYDSKGKLVNPEKPIIIGNNVWIGSYVKILKGVTIGNEAIIGMNSMVTKNITPKTLNVGNPAQCIKENIRWTLEYKNEPYESNSHS